MENGWLNLQPDQFAKLEEDAQELNLTERLGTQQQQQQQQQQIQQQQRQSQSQSPVGTKRKRGSTAKERISKMPPCTAGKRSSIYRGVTRHRWTGRYEAHLWDKGTWNVTQNKKGKQVYLGAYDDEEAAARAYDLAALKYWGPGTLINFPVSDYSRDIEEMQNVSREEYLASLRRKSSGFSRGVSKYRGVARHHHNGRWEARIGRVFGNKYLYHLFSSGTQEEAATAYDMAAIEYRGLNAVTNFDLSRYIRWLRPGQGNNLDTNTNNVNTETSSQNQADATGASDFADEIQLPTLGLARAAAAVTHNSNNSQKKNAPTALGLLLQSNMFKQMLEKTSANPATRHQHEFGEDQTAENAPNGEIDVVDEGSQYLVNDDSHGYPGVAGQIDDGYTPFQHDFGLTSAQQQGSQGVNQDGPEVQQQDDADGTGLSLWNSFGQSLGSLPLTSAISTC